MDLYSTWMGEGQGSEFIVKEHKDYGEKSSGEGGKRMLGLVILK